MDNWTERWNARYREEGYAYGEEPNVFLKEQLDQLPVGDILFPAEGEGRNAVHAARSGWQVSAFDISEEGQKKALQLAAKHGVSIQYAVGELEQLAFSEQSFDVLALIFAHFPPHLKSSLHQKLSSLLKSGGYVVFEAFSKNHLAYNQTNEQVGGPKDIDSLFSIDELQQDFQGFDFLQITETEVDLHEGRYHVGKGSVLRFVGRKNA